MSDYKTLKFLYLKLASASLIFLIFLVSFIFVLKFYEKIIIQKIENINILKENINQNKSTRERELKFQQLKLFFQQKTGREITTVLFDLQQKLNPDFNKTKDLILKKIDNENWQIIGSNFNFEEKKINLILELPQEKIENFLRFLKDQLLIIKIESLKIEKNKENYQLTLIFNLI